MEEFKILEGISSGSGEPIFSHGQTTIEVLARVDSFMSNEQSSGDQTNNLFNTLALSSDILVVKYESSDNEIRSYETYLNKDPSDINALLQYNYNMTTSSVDIVMSNIIKNITKELTPPKVSKAFTYDFKFSQNQNASISGSIGGGY
jgi:hypothetical protein